MTSIPQNLRYLAQTLNTRYHVAKTYRNGASVVFICRRYEFSKAETSGLMAEKLSARQIPQTSDTPSKSGTTLD